MSLLDLDYRLTNWLFIGQDVAIPLRYAIYSLASIFIYSLPIILLILFWRGKTTDRLNSVKIVFYALLCWQLLTSLIGAYLYSHYGFRDRPFAQLGLTELFFEQPHKAFPSDHAAVMMAAALGFFAYRYRTLGWVFLIGGVLSSLGRVLIGFHWLGDVVGGWVIALFGLALLRLVERPLTAIIRYGLESLRLIPKEYENR